MNEMKLDPKALEQLRKIGVHWNDALESFSKTLIEFGRAIRRNLEGMRQFINSPVVKEIIAFQTHAFTPDYDLRCTYPGCELFPEQHPPYLNAEA